ncbi:GTPase IMAP family member 9-like isoform X2 [Pygocentrus nattereri]|uniref:GTPase IMAP family member 9-like isoform X2 n=1 Tax=Pygocentrus nattereri TaxID=42514 RepID=UPI0018919501|nr:GTPase IMAP family member 9-like isoform X2 [Pygocentrus nattereri]
MHNLQNLQDCASLWMFEVPAKNKGAMNDLRIVLLGKTGAGKSSCGNTILNEDVDVFPTGHSSSSETHKCESRTKLINKKKISVVDAPGLCVTSLPEKELKSEILRCIVDSAPVPHAFVIVLRVERYTEQEKELVNKITAAFGEEALKYAVVLFTHGDQLSKDQRIEDFVKQSTELQGLVDKCGGRVHVIDNKYWNQQKDEYRNNRVQVEKLLKTIEEMVRKNGGQYYSKEMLQEVKRAIEVECENIIRNNNEESQDVNNNILQQAKQRVHTKLSKRLVGVTVGALLGALLGFGAALYVSYKAAQVVTPQTAASVAGVVGAVAGAVVGGCVGYKAVEGAETLTDAMKRSANMVWDNSEAVYEKIEQLIKRFQKVAVIGKTTI